MVGEAIIALVDGKKIGKNQSALPLELIIRKSCGAGDKTGVAGVQELQELQNWAASS
jgi:hypothetical protein